MWISNRKHAYKIVKRFKNGNVVYQNEYGAVMKTSLQRLEDSGYRLVKQKPRFGGAL